MNITKYARLVLSLLLVGLVLPAFAESKPVEKSADKAVAEKFDLLQIGTETYTNVTVTKSTSTDLICFTHSGGISTVKVSDLPDEAKARLGFEVPIKFNGEEFKAKISAQVKKVFARLDLSSVEPIRLAITDTVWQALLGDPSARNVLLINLGIAFLLYLLFCYCTKVICDKTGRRAGALVWLPVLQWIPMFRAARMSPAWILSLFIPLINVVTLLVWAFKITAARGKHWMVAVLFIFPVTTLFAFLYLAFADASNAVDEAKPRARHSPIMTLETA